VRCTHCSDCKAQGASGNYKAQGAIGNYKAQGASGNYKAWGASGGKYEAQMVIFCILAAVNRFYLDFLKRGKPLRKIGKPMRKIRKPIGENWISCEDNQILGEKNLDIGEGFQNISMILSSIGDLFPTCNW
jgi:hypothetical protein